MKLKISESLICIPPYISTTWERVAFLQSEKQDDNKNFILIIQLHEGKTVKIPHLDASIIDIAFAAHIQYLEKHGASTKKEERGAGGIFQALMGNSSQSPTSFPLRFGTNGLPNGMDGLETAFMHNPSQSNSPNLPPEVIEKIAGIAKVMTNGDLSGFPKPEPHCNCMHCQVSRAIHELSPKEEEVDQEDIVTDEDLHFRNWEIAQVAEHLFVVTSPLDQREQYSVYLGTPVGCTCGEPHCEHIKAVLAS